MYQKRRNRFSFILIFAIALFLVQNPFTNQYVSNLKMTAMPVQGKENALYKEITEKKSDYYIAPEDAKVDKVWKAVPGYNGLKVDVEASYKKMKKDGVFSEEKLVFKQIPPSVHLEDLKAAPVYIGNKNKPMVSFIINVAWGNEYLSPMLATLKDHNIKATFFLEGRWVKENPELAQMIVDAGHEVGNHSYSHPNMETIASQKAVEEIIMTNEVIKATTGIDVKLFAPPSGSYRDEIVTIAAEQGLKTIMWSVDTIDWRKPTPQQLVARVTKKIHNGAIVLMHPTQSTASSLETLILEMEKRDLHIGTVSDLLDEERIIK